MYSAEGKSRFSYIMGITSSAILKLLKSISTNDISIDYNNFRLPYITSKPKKNVLMDTQLPPDSKIELAYGGNLDP